jgi:rhodanese-related sulfurtransferase
MKRLIGFFIAALILSNFVAIAQTTVPETDITVKDLKLQIKENQHLVILDVRTPKELNGPLGKIKGVINIPVQDLEKRVDELDKYKNDEIAVICRTGHRSAIGTKILMDHGFKKVENVKGGMTAYRKN